MERTPAFPIGHGTEWETVWYAGRILQQPNGKQKLEYQRPDTTDCRRAIRYRDPRLIGMGDVSKVMLNNGGVMYIDVGDKLEYGSPEAASITEALQRDYDAEKIVYDALQRLSQQELPDDENPIVKTALYKRTYTSGRHFFDDGTYVVRNEGPKSCGYHLNMGLPERTGQSEGLTITSKDLLLYGMHLATSAPLLGTGLVEPFEKRFLLHQRAPFIGTSFSSSTTRRRPVVNTRNEPHSDGVRIHGITLDPCISPWGGLMQRGTSELVLRLSAMMSRGWVPERLLPSGSYSLKAIAQQTARDLTFRETFTLDSGRSITAIDSQEIICTAAREMSEHVELPLENYTVLDEWELAIADLRENPMRLADRQDWPMKLKMIMRGITSLDADTLEEIANFPWDSQDAETKDTEFTRLGPGTVSEKLRNRIWAKWMPPTEKERTMAERCLPPTSTRAVVRGAYIDLYGAPPGEPMVHGVDWSRLGTGSGVSIPNLFETDTTIAANTPPPRAFMEYYGSDDWSD